MPSCYGKNEALDSENLLRATLPLTAGAGAPLNACFCDKGSLAILLASVKLWCHVSLLLRSMLAECIHRTISTSSIYSVGTSQE
jgi:hypothetical protein